MPQIPIKMPQLGESIAEATILSYLVPEGEDVAADVDVIEVETNKATLCVTAPYAGRLVRFTAAVGESYPVGATLGFMEVAQGLVNEPEDAAGHAPGADAAETRNGSSAAMAASDRHAIKPTVRGLPVPAEAAAVSYISPRMKARMHELGLHAADLSGIAGSGAGGRVTIQDFEAFIAGLEQKKLTPASSMRVAVADAMRRSWTRPLAHVGLPAGLDAMLQHRKTCDPKPGPALYALRALGMALAENSATAGRLIGNKIVHPSAIDIGFAVEAEEGVLVPVLRSVDKRSLLDLTEDYNSLVRCAKERRLPPNATGESIATVTNFGTFGLTWATPIPLPEQTLVLGLGAGRRVPDWDEDQQRFVPVMQANLTLSFDHRVLDGGAAGRLLARVAALLSAPQSL